MIDEDIYALRNRVGEIPRERRALCLERVVDLRDNHRDFGEITGYGVEDEGVDLVFGERHGGFLARGGAVCHFFFSIPLFYFCF